MKKNLTQMVFVLDMSGSMKWLAPETIGGYNTMLADQKKEDGDALVTTVLFDNRYIMVHDGVDIKKVQNLTDKEYRPEGMTAMLDAVGRTINHSEIDLQICRKKNDLKKLYLQLSLMVMRMQAMNLTGIQ